MLLNLKLLMRRGGEAEGEAGVQARRGLQDLCVPSLLLPLQGKAVYKLVSSLSGPQSVRETAVCTWVGAIGLYPLAGREEPQRSWSLQGPLQGHKHSPTVES